MAALPENPDSVPAPTWGLTVAVCLNSRASDSLLDIMYRYICT